jgi:hypothetical protein
MLDALLYLMPLSQSVHAEGDDTAGVTEFSVLPLAEFKWRLGFCPTRQHYAQPSCLQRWWKEQSIARSIV